MTWCAQNSKQSESVTEILSIRRLRRCNCHLVNGCLPVGVPEHQCVVTSSNGYRRMTHVWIHFYGLHTDPWTIRCAYASLARATMKADPDACEVLCKLSKWRTFNICIECAFDAHDGTVNVKWTLNASHLLSGDFIGFCVNCECLERNEAQNIHRKISLKMMLWNIKGNLETQVHRTWMASSTVSGAWTWARMLFADRTIRSPFKRKTHNAFVLIARRQLNPLFSISPSEAGMDGMCCAAVYCSRKKSHQIN